MGRGEIDETAERIRRSNLTLIEARSDEGGPQDAIFGSPAKGGEGEHRQVNPYLSSPDGRYYGAREPIMFEQLLQLVRRNAPNGRIIWVWRPRIETNAPLVIVAGAFYLEDEAVKRLEEYYGVRREALRLLNLA